MLHRQTKQESAEGHLARLEAEVLALRKRVRATRQRPHQTHADNAESVTPAPAVASHDQRRRTGAVILAPGYVATTIPGSLYSTLLKLVAAMGGLAQHDARFAVFTRNPTARAARRLLDAMAVPVHELEQRIRSDAEYLQHCKNREQMLKHRAARGDTRAQKAMQNPARCSPKGRWMGNVREAIDTLYAARDRNNLRRCKNIRILKKIRLMFDTIDKDGVRACFLYPEKYHATFRQARSLAGYER